MPRAKQHTKGTDALRKKAEARIARQLDRIESASSEDIPRLIHELRIHQVELEVQNEELRVAQSELEVSRSKYTHLYDFAPVAYLTISKDGVIEETNLTAKSILGADSKALVGSRVSWLIADGDSALFHQHMNRTLETGTRQTCQLRLRERGGETRHVQIESVLSYGGQEKIFSAVIDITPQKKLEARILEAHDELEARVRVRTADLVKAKEMLEAEVSERRRAEARSRAHEKELEELNANLRLEIEKRKSFEAGLRLSTERIIREHTQRKALSRQLVELLEKDRREVAMALHDHAGQILSIEDDGLGFELAQAPFTTLEPGHLGITIMRERVLMLGGDFRIESQPGKGTVVMAEIPFGEIRNPNIEIRNKFE